MRKLEDLAKEAVDAAFQVHKTLGPGLLESAYETCLVYELEKRNISVQTQVSQNIQYGNLVIDAGYRLDLLVEEQLIIELKAVESILPIHRAQLLTYLKLSKRTLGLLINFNVPLLKNGINRVVNNHPSQ